MAREEWVIRAPPFMTDSSAPPNAARFPNASMSSSKPSSESRLLGRSHTGSTEFLPRSASDSDRLTHFRQKFFEGRQALIGAHGPDAYDQGQVLYLCDECDRLRAASGGDPIVVSDAFYGQHPQGPVEAFVRALTAGWWRGRQTLQQQSCPGCGSSKPLCAGHGLYGHYLPDVGFDLVIELGASGPLCCWRSDARGRTTRIVVPDDELQHWDLLGTFFDLRAGWRSLVRRHREMRRRRAGQESSAVVVAEVQPGYIIGVRKGDPADRNPAERYDPELEHVFSRWDSRDYDTLEFLTAEEARAYPFHGERFGEWLDETLDYGAEGRPGNGGASRPNGDGEIDLFVLAQSTAFTACVDDLCQAREVEVEWIDAGDTVEARLQAGELRLQLDLAYPFLRTLHTGRTFSEGARAFFGPHLDALDQGKDALEIARSAIEGMSVEVERGAILVLSDAAGQVVGRWNLLALAGRLPTSGRARRDTLLRLLRYDPASHTLLEGGRDLDTCPICGSRARIAKVLGLERALGVETDTLVGVSVGAHFVYFTVECPDHSTPLAPAPSREIGVLEARYQAGLEHAVTTLVDTRALTPGVEISDGWPGRIHLLVGFEISSTLIEPGRLKAILEHVEIDLPKSCHAYAFYPDAMVVSDTALAGKARLAAQHAALEAIVPRFPHRAQALEAARTISLDVRPVGHVRRLVDS